MKNPLPQSHPLSFLMRLFTILLCFAAGGFCLFKSGLGQSVEQPAVAASAPVKTAQAPSPTSEFKLKSVADFKVGDTIMAYNHETGEREQKIVKQTFQRQVDHLRFLEVQGEDGSRQTIKTTDEHPFWVPSAGEYLEAKQLKPGTRLTGANGHFITVISTRYESHPEGVTVYNVEVEGFHNYFVAANGYRGPPVLAHNKCKVDTDKIVNDDVATKGIHIKVDGQELRLHVRNGELDYGAAFPHEASDKKVLKAIKDIKKQGLTNFQIKKIAKDSRRAIDHIRNLNIEEIDDVVDDVTRVAEFFENLVENL